MRTITISYPSTFDAAGTEIDNVQLIHDAFANAFGWTETIPDPENPEEEIPNPQSKEEHMHERLLDYIEQVANAYSPHVVDAQGALKQAEAEQAALSAEVRKDATVKEA